MPDIKNAWANYLGGGKESEKRERLNQIYKIINGYRCAGRVGY